MYSFINENYFDYLISNNYKYIVHVYHVSYLPPSHGKNQFLNLVKLNQIQIVITQFLIDLAPNMELRSAPNQSENCNHDMNSVY